MEKLTETITMLAEAMGQRAQAMLNPPPTADDQLSVGLGGDVPVFPPLMILLLIVAGLVLRSALPRVRICPPLLRPLFVRILLFGVALGGFFSMIGMITEELATGDTHPDFKPVKGLVKTGVFSMSRNPLYATGVVLLCPTIALLFDDLWMLVAMIGMPLYLGFVVIPAEEKLLARLFPKEFAAYAADVPRWGDPSALANL